MLTSVDQVHLNFSPTGLLLLNFILGIVMFGIALDIRVDDFRRVARYPRAVLIGLGSQFLVFPALTFLLVLLLEPAPSMALGMFLVAACPGGNISNFLTHHAGGNTALSVTMSAVSTAAAIVMTPLNFGFWSSLLPETAALLREVRLDPLSMLLTILVLLGIPLVCGMSVAHNFPTFAARMRRPMRWFSLVVFGLFVVGALAANFQHFLDYFGLVILVVVVHNAAALFTGYSLSRAAGVPEAERRAVAIEVGIQNSGLGLILIFDFFGGMGGMALVAAAWGIWHLVSGLTLATWWSRRMPSAATVQADAG